MEKNDRRVVAVEEVAAALSRAAHTRATMPDYSVTRVAFDEQDGEEVWWVQPVRPGTHPGDCRQPIRDPNVFWPAGRSYSNRARDAFFKAQRAETCDQLAGVLLDTLHGLQHSGVMLTMQGETVAADGCSYTTAHLHELQSGFHNPVLRCADGHVTLLIRALHLYPGRDDEAAVGHAWVSVRTESGALWGVDVSATQLDVCEYTQEGYPLAVFAESGDATDSRWSGSARKQRTVHEWRADLHTFLEQMTSPTAASSYQQQMRELRRTLMAQVLGDDAAEQSLDSDEQNEEQRELAALMKELQANPFVHRKGTPAAANAVDDSAVRARLAEEGEGAERGRRAREAKALGGVAFKAGRFMDAAEHYAAALHLFPAQSAEAVTCHSNRAQCFLSLGTHLDAALDACRAALDVQPTHTKSRYRLALTHKLMQQPAKAKAELRRLLRHEPHNVEAQQLLQACLQGMQRG